YVASGVINAAGETVAARLAVIFRGLRAAIEKYRPEAAAVETVFAGNNLKTAITIGEARGVALLAAAVDNLPVAGYEPTVVKRAVTGNGHATKEQVQRLMQILLNLPQLPPSDHEADALAMALTHLRRQTVARRLPR
ncbi:MAG: crossover junction endodeoxyribonuclease RuvC, partial [Planctomycetota bacterium]|nr:crossover junction endodeoxyribonuclease RuvC [Planctomycetota bacterium]